MLTEFNRSVHSQQYVVALDVSMDDLIGVKKLQCLQDLDANKQHWLHKSVLLFLVLFFWYVLCDPSEDSHLKL